MRETGDLVSRLASTDLGILVLGETGTGKDLVAQDVHHRSRRSNAPFCVVNCAAIPDTLIEGTLFGHERGAFTGADRTRPGLFERASGGTVFLDEVGELSPAAQAALLRVLDSRRFTRLGGDREIAVDVRVVAATHRDLHAMVARGAFRRDLLHRLSIATIELPPLRERRDEIVPLARHFLAQQSAIHSLHASSEARLERHDWPGNVRELRNVVARAAALARELVLVEADLLLLPDGVTASREPPAPPSGVRYSFRARLDSMIRAEVETALESTAGNQRQAAELLGMPLRTLERHVRRWRSG